MKLQKSVKLEFKTAEVGIAEFKTTEVETAEVKMSFKRIQNWRKSLKLTLNC